MLAGEGRHGLAARGCAVFGGDGGAVELGDLHEVGAGPELVFERIEARGEFGGVGLGHEASFSCFAVIAHECTHPSLIAHVLGRSMVRKRPGPHCL